jgi:hypothetical protein
MRILPGAEAQISTFPISKMHVFETLRLGTSRVRGVCTRSIVHGSYAIQSAAGRRYHEAAFPCPTIRSVELSRHIFRAHAHLRTRKEQVCVCKSDSPTVINANNFHIFH